MFIKEIFNNMYNFDVTSIVKCYVVPEGRLKETEVMYLDYVHNDDEDKSNSPFSIGPMTTSNTQPASIAIKVFTRNLLGETIKSTFLSHMNDIFEEILNTYHEMHLENLKDTTFPKLEYNSKEDIRRLTSKAYACSNIIAQKSRRGNANVFILPNNKYESLFKTSFPNDKVVINPTESHKDKIFVVRVDLDTSSPGLSLFITRNIVTGRYLKLVKLMGKMGRKIDDLSFNYILTKIGFTPEYQVRCIYLTEN